MPASRVPVGGTEETNTHGGARTARQGATRTHTGCSGGWTRARGRTPPPSCRRSPNTGPSSPSWLRGGGGAGGYTRAVIANPRNNTLAANEGRGTRTGVLRVCLQDGIGGLNRLLQVPLLVQGLRAEGRGMANTHGSTHPARAGPQRRPHAPQACETRPGLATTDPAWISPVVWAAWGVRGACGVGQTC